MNKNTLKIVTIMGLFFAGMAPVSHAQDHALFDSMLNMYVQEGKVNYKGLCKDDRLGQYTDQLERTDPDTLPTQEDQLAFWINTYNAFTLDVICQDYPIKSMNDLNFGGLLMAVALKKTVWDRKFININGQQLSLRAIEHEIIRPQFQDPRSHIALACGAISCPPLSSTAYDGAKLNQQLDEQAKQFFNKSFYNSFDLKNKKARLSVILDWNKRYFGSSQKEVLAFAAGFTPYRIDNLDQWKIKYNKYDLRLNDEKN